MQDDPGRVQAASTFGFRVAWLTETSRPRVQPGESEPAPSGRGRSRRWYRTGVYLKVCEMAPGQPSEPVPARSDLHSQSSLDDIRTWHSAYLCARAPTVAQSDADVLFCAIRKPGLMSNVFDDFP